MNCWGREPRLAEILADPIVEAIMAADGVDPQQLLVSLCKTASKVVQLTQAGNREKHHERHPRDRRVVGRRRAQRARPQGLMDRHLGGEMPVDAEHAGESRCRRAARPVELHARRLPS